LAEKRRSNSPTRNEVVVGFAPPAARMPAQPVD